MSTSGEPIKQDGPVSPGSQKSGFPTKFKVQKYTKKNTIDALTDGAVGKEAEITTEKAGWAEKRHEDKPFDRQAFRKVVQKYCWSFRPEDRATMVGLLENSTDINMENKGERLSTIAHEIACLYGKNPKAAQALNDIMQMLIDYGVDIDKQNKLGETPTEINFIKTIYGVGYKFVAKPKK